MKKKLYQSKANKKGQNATKKSQSCAKIVILPIKTLVFFFARQGLSGPQKSILCDVYFITLNDIDLLIYAN